MKYQYRQYWYSLYNAPSKGGRYYELINLRIKHREPNVKVSYNNPRPQWCSKVVVCVQPAQTLLIAKSPQGHEKQAQEEVADTRQSGPFSVGTPHHGVPMSRRVGVCGSSAITVCKKSLGRGPAHSVA